MSSELRNALRATRIRELEPAPPFTSHADVPASAAVDRMSGGRHGCILVVDDEDRLCGIFTERDLIRRILAPDRPLATPLHAVMTAGPEAVSLEDSASRALRLLVGGGYRHLPVVDDEGRPKGILSVKHFIHWLCTLCPEAVYSPPPDPDHVVPRIDGG